MLNRNVARVDVNILLAFTYWVGIALHPWPFISDIAIFVLKGDIKLQLTNCWFYMQKEKKKGKSEDSASAATCELF